MRSFVYAVVPAGMVKTAVVVVRADRRRSSLAFVDPGPGGSGDVQVGVDDADDDARGRQYQHDDELDRQQCYWPTHLTTVIVRRHIARIDEQVL